MRCGVGVLYKCACASSRLHGGRLCGVCTCALCSALSQTSQCFTCADMLYMLLLVLRACLPLLSHCRDTSGPCVASAAADL